MNQIVANRYAEALFQVAKEKDIVDQLLNEWQVVRTVAQSTPQLLQILNHPKITSEQKRTFVESAFGQVLSKTSLHTFFLLIDRKRLGSLIPMISSFEQLAYEDQEVAEAIVYSAKPLSEQEQTQISTIFSKRIGKTKLIIKNIVNSELIGGLTIRIGDYIYDGSVKSRLDRIERQLISGTTR